MTQVSAECSRGSLPQARSLSLTRSQFTVPDTAPVTVPDAVADPGRGKGNGLEPYSFSPKGKSTVANVTSGSVNTLAFTPHAEIEKSESSITTLRRIPAAPQ